MSAPMNPGTTCPSCGAANPPWVGACLRCQAPLPNTTPPSSLPPPQPSAAAQSALTPSSISHGPGAPGNGRWVLVAAIVIAAGVVLAALFAFGVFTPKTSSSPTSSGCSSATAATIDTYRIQSAAQTLQLSPSSGMYIFEGSTGGHPLTDASWNADLNVTDLGTPGGPAISIGHSSSSTGSYSTSAGNFIIAGVGVSNFCSYQIETAHAASFRSPIDTWVNFTTTDANEAIIIVGGEGVGSLGLTGSSLPTLGDQTYSQENNGVNASVAIFGGSLPPGAYSLEATSTMNIFTNSGSGGSLGVVVYLFPYNSSSKSTPLGTVFAWGVPINATDASPLPCGVSNGFTIDVEFCYSIEIAGAGGGVTTSNVVLSLKNSDSATVPWPTLGSVQVTLLSPMIAGEAATYGPSTGTWTTIGTFNGEITAGMTLLIGIGGGQPAGSTGGFLGVSLVSIGQNGFTGSVSSIPFA